MARMSRTTIMADDALLDELREIAKEEGVSLGEVIRQGLEWRAKTRRRVPSFIAAVDSSKVAEPMSSAPGSDEDMIMEYVRRKHDRIRADREADRLLGS